LTVAVEVSQAFDVLYRLKDVATAGGTKAPLFFMAQIDRVKLDLVLSSAAAPFEVSLLPIGFVAVRKLSIEASWSAGDIAAAKNATGFGPFKVDSAIVDIKSYHTTAFICKRLRKCPDQSSPSGACGSRGEGAPKCTELRAARYLGRGSPLGPEHIKQGTSAQWPGDVLGGRLCSGDAAHQSSLATAADVRNRRGSRGSTRRCCGHRCANRG
jgi:hypothetical protein